QVVLLEARPAVAALATHVALVDEVRIARLRPAVPMLHLAAHDASSPRQPRRTGELPERRAEIGPVGAKPWEAKRHENPSSARASPSTTAGSRHPSVPSCRSLAE